MLIHKDIVMAFILFGSSLADNVDPATVKCRNTVFKFRRFTDAGSPPDCAKECRAATTQKTTNPISPTKCTKYKCTKLDIMGGATGENSNKCACSATWTLCQLPTTQTGQGCTLDALGNRLAASLGDAWKYDSTINGPEGDCKSSCQRFSALSKFFMTQSNHACQLFSMSCLSNFLSL